MKNGQKEAPSSTVSHAFSRPVVNGLRRCPTPAEKVWDQDRDKGIFSFARSSS